MIMKKIIAFIICLALCVSAVAVGVMNQQAKSGVGISGAAANAAVGSGVNVTLDNVASGNTGTVGNAYADPSGAPSTVGNDKDGIKVVTSPVNSIVQSGNNWYLTGNMTITSASQLTDLAAALNWTPSYTLDSTNAEKTENLNARPVFDGQGYTITTSIPLFDTLTQCVIKDLTIAGNISVSDVNSTAGGVGILTDLFRGIVHIENVAITANLTYTGSTNAATGGLASFASYPDTTCSHNKIYLTDCAFTGSIKYAASGTAAGEVKTAGLVGRAQSCQVHIKGCTVNPTEMYAKGHFGGVLQDVNTSSRTTITNTYVELNDNVTFLGGTSYAGGFVGNHGASELTITNSRVAGSLTLDSGASYVGAFTGRDAGGTSTYKNINSTLSISSGTNTAAIIGGVIGINGATIKIDGYSTTYDGVTGTITPASYCGGVIGNINGTGDVSIGNATIDTIINKTSGANQIGGITAQTGAAANLTIGEVDGVAAPVVLNSTITTTINSHTGGVVGCTNNSSTITIKNFTSNAVITGGRGTGGIVGVAQGSDSITIMDSTINGSVNLTSAHETYYGTAGVIGVLSTTMPVTITNCIIAADVTTDGANTPTAAVVGIVKGASTLTMTNNELSGTVTHTSGGDVTGGVIARTAADGIKIVIDGLDVTSDFSITTNDATGLIIGRTENGSVEGLSNATAKYASIFCRGVKYDGTIKTTSTALLGGLIGTNLEGITGTVGTVGETTYTQGLVFEDCVIGGTFDYSQSGDTAFGAFLGRTNVLVEGGILFDNCTVNTDQSYEIDSTTESALSVGGFIGRTQAAAQTITFVDCVNNGNITITNSSSRTSTSVWGNAAGGFIGYPVSGDTITFTNCVNAGNISVSVPVESTGLGDVNAGGFVGTGNAATTFTNCHNYGDISASGARSGKNVRAAGFDNSPNGVKAFTECVNVGNITTTATHTSGTNGRVGGFTTHAAAVHTLTNCVNAGTITMSNAKSGQPAGGFFAYAPSAADGSTMNYCVNIGDIVSNSSTGGPYCGGGGNVTTTNCYDYDTTTSYLLSANMKSVKANNAKAYIALILADQSYNVATVDESKVASYMATQLADAFTVDATLTDGICYTYVDKDFYDAIEAIAGDSNVYFDGIVTPSRVAAKVSSVTIKTLTDLKTSTDSTIDLYMDADREEQNITDGDIAIDDNTQYKVKIVLIGGYDTLTYTARAYIKIGSAYIYSAVAE